MPKKNISAFIWRAVFTVSYTAVVLPFTVNFFKSIASPSSTETLMLMIPVIDAHNFMLPVLLAGLEFAAIGLACALWKKAASTKKVVILILFLSCQTIPMLSLYYDVRGKDYEMEKKSYDNRKKELMDSLSNRVRALNGQISALSKNITDIKKERHDTNKSINQLLLIRKELPRDAVADMKAEIQERKKLRERDEEKVADLFKQKKSLEADIKKWEDQLQAAQSQTMKYGTQLEYIVRELLNHKSVFAGFIAFLFPVTLLSVAFILPKKTSADAEMLPSFNLQEHLRNAASLPEDMHFNYARLLVPSCDAYISAFKASKTILNENDALNFHHALIRRIINEVKGLQEEIASSKLEENSKSYLLNELNTILNKKLTVKEEMSYV
jgi:outer membrane murein-binding lipoprotein Lpp